MSKRGAKREVVAGDNAEGLPISLAVRFGDLVFVSGMVGFDAAGRVVPGGIAAETRQTFANIEAILKKAGCTLADIVKVSVVLSDPKEFDAFNAAFAAIFKDSRPARVTIAGTLTIDARIEIDAIAGVPDA